jgi:hypothetical protein
MKIDRFELHIINNNNNIDGHSGICEQQKYCLAGQEIKVNWGWMNIVQYFLNILLYKYQLEND